MITSISLFFYNLKYLYHTGDRFLGKCIHLFSQSLTYAHNKEMFYNNNVIWIYDKYIQLGNIFSEKLFTSIDK